MDSPPEVLSLVAPNGLGHLRRQVGILSRLLDRRPDLRIHLLASESQVKAGKEWPAGRRFLDDPRVRYQTGILDPGVGWFTRAEEYSRERLWGWLARLESVPGLRHAKLVVSDNLGMALAYREDAVLAGSFLWGEILQTACPADAVVSEFVARELDLVAQVRPPMLCVGDVAMPAVVERTRAVPLGWMCEVVRPDPERSGLRRIAVLAGASGAADSVTGRLARSLAAAGYPVAAPSAVVRRVPGTIPFGHGPEDFAALGAAVCRPGIGTVTECIAYGVPMVTFSEAPSNPELAHNGRRLAELGVALDLGVNPEPADVRTAVEAVLSPPRHEAMRQAIRGLRKDGLDRAVEFLLRRLEQST